MSPRPEPLGDVLDSDLVGRAQDGDRRALEELLTRHQPRIRAVCQRIIGDASDASDASQEALIAVVRGLHTFDGRSTFGTWVYRIATNASLDELRRRRRRPALSRDHDLGDDSHSDANVPRGAGAAGPSDARIADQLVITSALARLPEEFRTAVVLRDVADLDYAEIADVLGIPPGTVRSRIARGRSALAAALGNRTDLDGRPTPDDEHTAAGDTT